MLAHLEKVNLILQKVLIYVTLHPVGLLRVVTDRADVRVLFDSLLAKLVLRKPGLVVEDDQAEGAKVLFQAVQVPFAVIIDRHGAIDLRVVGTTGHYHDVKGAIVAVGDPSAPQVKALRLPVEAV